MKGDDTRQKDAKEGHGVKIMSSLSEKRSPANILLLTRQWITHPGVLLEHKTFSKIKTCFTDQYGQCWYIYVVWCSA